MDTCRAFSKTSDDSKTLKYHVAFLDSAADTCGIGEPSWYIDETSDRTLTIEGYNSGTTTKENVPIGTGLTVVDLPDGESILLQVHEATVLGEIANTLFSEMQMEQNGIIIQRASDGRRYIEIEGYMIPFTVKEEMQTLLTPHPTEQELRTL